MTLDFDADDGYTSRRQFIHELRAFIDDLPDDVLEHYIKAVRVLTACYRLESDAVGVMLVNEDEAFGIVGLGIDRAEVDGMIYSAYKRLGLDKLDTPSKTRFVN